MSWLTFMCHCQDECLYCIIIFVLLYIYYHCSLPAVLLLLKLNYSYMICHTFWLQCSIMFFVTISLKAVWVYFEVTVTKIFHERIDQDRTKIGPFFDCLLHFSIFLLCIFNIALQLSCKAMIKIWSKDIENRRNDQSWLVLSWDIFVTVWVRPIKVQHFKLYGCACIGGGGRNGYR